MRLKLYNWVKVRRLCIWGIIDFFLSRHVVRKEGKHFKGEANHWPKPVCRTGEDVFDMVNDLKVIFGRGLNILSVPHDDNGHTSM
jgi:hypothetical protein